MLSLEQLAFVNNCRVGRLATTSASGEPHVVPVCFAFVDACFWVAIDEKPKRGTHLKRLRNIKENPKVALLFDRWDEDWRRLAYVLVHGTADVLGRGDGMPGVLAALRERYPQYREMRLEERPLIRITPERVVAWGDIASHST